MMRADGPSPAVLVGAACWDAITAELDRVYPAEGILVPLVGLLPRDRRATPCTPLALSAIAEVVIARCVRVPPERQRNTLCRVSVLPEADQIVNEEVLALTARHPRLRACGYLHSHPFARGVTWPSSGSGCDVDGHMRPLLAHNRGAGLEASFSFIACRDLASRAWLLHAFALEPGGALRDLGLARVVADDSPSITPLLLRGLRTRSPQRFLLRRWRRSLVRAALRHRIDDLFDGWLRAVVELEGGRAVLLLPCDFPANPLRVFAVPGDRAPRQVPAPPSVAPDAWLQAVRRVEEVLHEKQEKEAEEADHA